MKIVSVDSLLMLDQLVHRYPDGSLGLNGCSLNIARGSRNALIGANGSGKTTLFLHSNGLLQASSGAVHYAGQPVDYRRNGLRALRSKVGLVFQNPDRQLFSANVAEDVSFGPLNLGLDEATVRQRVTAALTAVGMLAEADKAVHNLSFGQKKRVCIAGVLAMEPELLVLDEPMAGLDPSMQADLLAMLNDLHGKGMTIILSTHDVDFAYRWADQIHLMAAGRCAASFPAPELPAHTADLAAAGLPLPTVVTLHAALLAHQLVPAEPAPRSTVALLAMLPTGEDIKETACKIA
jgi:cobalt/nickel transport system ATP-binding protein